jgi:endonuclease/exonuclease/phosphatase family metal-dependent hydrolase
VILTTFNLRFENNWDGPNSWKLRRKLVIDLIKKYDPFILGTQEGMLSQLVYIRNELSEYHLSAPHRILDDTCQYPTLFFLKKLFTVHEGGEFWLSKTPDVHRSKSWDSAFPRMMSYARVSEADSDDDFWVAVTHLDHMGAEARYHQANIIADWIKNLAAPVILMGDFNDNPGSPVHSLLTSTETGLQDTWEVLDQMEGASSFTHHAFTGVPRQARMDWILVSPHFRVIRVEIIRDHYENRYPSDHFPYLSEVELKG